MGGKRNGKGDRINLRRVQAGGPGRGGQKVGTTQKARKDRGRKNDQSEKGSDQLDHGKGREGKGKTDLRVIS